MMGKWNWYLEWVGLKLLLFDFVGILWWVLV